MNYESVLASLLRLFGDQSFTVGEAAVRLGYEKTPGTVAGDDAPRRGGFPFPPDPSPDERTRQHAKSDFWRLYGMGLLNRRPVRTGRSGRRPYTYRVSRKGKNYLDWLRGHGLVDAFEAFAEAGIKDAVPTGDRLLRRLRALEGRGLDRATLNTLELELSALVNRPSLEAYIGALQFFAYAVIMVTGDAPLEAKLRVDRKVLPFFTGRYVIEPPNGTAGPQSKSTWDQAMEMASLGIKAFEIGAAAGKAGVTVKPSIPAATPPQDSGKRGEGQDSKNGTSRTGPVKQPPIDVPAELVRWVMHGVSGGAGEKRPSHADDLPFHLQDTVFNRQLFVLAWRTLAESETAYVPWPSLDSDGKPVLDSQGQPVIVVLPLKRHVGDLETFQHGMQGWNGDAHTALRALVRAFGPTARVGSSGGDQKSKTPS